MKNKYITYYVAILLSLGAIKTNAQENVVSSGGNATGTGGKVSYSIGQAFYISSSNASGSVSQGVQHPYEIQVSLGVEEHEINLYAKVYPNPTTDFINLTIGETESKDLHYQLYDYTGKILSKGKISARETSIPMSNYSHSNYLLSVTKNNQTIKTFKILKK